MGPQLWRILGMGAVEHVLLTIAGVSLALIVYDRWLRHSNEVPLLAVSVAAIIILLPFMFFTIPMWRF